MMKKILAGLLVMASLLLLLAGCGNNSAETPEKRMAAGNVNIGISQDLDESLDPHFTVAAGTREVLFNVFEGLVKPNAAGELVPAVASDVTVADDGLTYTFTLRQGVKFHNGNPVTLQDVLFSINRNVQGTDGTPLIASLGSVSDVRGDGDKVIVTLSEANPEFLSSMTLAIIPEGYEDQGTAPIGTGPFKFVSRTAQDSVVLERFKDYWGTPATMNKVTYKVIENVEGLILGLQSGALDLVAHLSPTQTAQLNTADFHIVEGTMNLVQALYLNNAVEPFTDVRVRQALCYAIDKREVIDMAFDGYGHPLGSSMYPAFTKYYDESLTDYYTKDIDKAKSLLAEAGYPNGFDMTITVPSNYQPHVDTAQVLAELLKEIGVNATILPVEWATWLSDTYSGRQFQSTVIGFDASEMTARAMLGRYYSQAHNNFNNYNNEEYDELFLQATSCFDDAQQTQLYRAMERNLTENAANVYLQDMADLVAVRNGLEGPTFYPLYVLDVSSLHWTK